MTHDPSETGPLEPPLGQLERALIEEFLRARGYDPAGLDLLPAAEREKLLRDASLYASTKLTEIEARSHLVDRLHEGGGGGEGHS